MIVVKTETVTGVSDPLVPAMLSTGERPSAKLRHIFRYDDGIHQHTNDDDKTHHTNKVNGDIVEEEEANSSQKGKGIPKAVIKATRQGGSLKEL